MNKKKIYTVKAKFVFEGEFQVAAENKAQAKEFVEKHCGLCLGGNIHTTTPDVLDWEFSSHPKKVIR